MLICAAFCLASCNGGRGGIVITGDGSVVDNTPEHARDHAQQQIAGDLIEILAPRSVTVVIAPLPRWQNENRLQAEGWYWDNAHVDLQVGGAIEESERARMIAAVHLRLSAAITGGRDACVISMTAVDPPPADSPVTGRHYTIQAGDTLADISTVFYGNAQHWRIIIAANPGLDPAHVQVGRELVIPPLPSAR